MKLKPMLITCLVFILIVLTAPAAGRQPPATPSGQERCQKEYAALGFRNVRQCVSHHARGDGTVVTGPADSTLTDDTSACASVSGQDCICSVVGSGLDAGSQVMVGDAGLLYGAALDVDADGTSRCTESAARELRGRRLRARTFMARGVPAGGTPIASPEVSADLTLHTPICP